MPKFNYWGQPQEQEEVLDGITWVSSASHGGFVLSDERFKKMPEWTKSVGYGASEGCFEEDCNQVLVLWYFQDEFKNSVSNKERAQSIKNLLTTKDISEYVKMYFPQHADKVK